MAFEWTDLIEPGLGLAGSVIGNKIQAGPAQAGVKEGARQFDVKNSQNMQARNMLMPAIQRHLGYTTPSSAFSTGGGGYPAAQGGGGGLGKVLGTTAKVGLAAAPFAIKALGGGAAAAGAGGGAAAGGAAGAAGAAGGGAAAGGAAGAAGAAGGGGGFLGALGGLATNPITWAIGGGLIGAKLLRKIGAGRRQADKLTDSSGIETNMVNALKQIAARKEAGQLSPQQADLLTERIFRDTAQKGLQFAGGGNNQRKVVQQMLNNYNWNPTIARIAPEYLSQLG